jgi:hypothetical protein
LIVLACVVVRQIWYQSIGTGWYGFFTLRVERPGISPIVYRRIYAADNTNYGVNNIPFVVEGFFHRAANKKIWGVNSTNKPGIEQYFPKLKIINHGKREHFHTR